MLYNTHAINNQLSRQNARSPTRRTVPDAKDDDHHHSDRRSAAKFGL